MRLNVGAKRSGGLSPGLLIFAVALPLSFGWQTTLGRLTGRHRARDEVVVVVKLTFHNSVIEQSGGAKDSLSGNRNSFANNSFVNETKRERRTTT